MDDLERSVEGEITTNSTPLGGTNYGEGQLIRTGQPCSKGGGGYRRGPLLYTMISRNQIGSKLSVLSAEKPDRKKKCQRVSSRDRERGEGRHTRSLKKRQGGVLRKSYDCA